MALKLTNWIDRVASLLPGSRAVSRAPVAPMNIETVCEKFWEIEKRLSLLTWSSGDVYPWPMLRMQIYYMATRKLGLYDNAHPAARWDNTVAAQEAVEAYWTEQEKKFAALAPGGRAANTARPYAVLMATKKINGSEPYSEAIRAELGSRAILLERSLDGHLTEGAIDFGVLQRIFSARYKSKERRKLSAQDLRVIESIRAAIEESLGVDLGDLARQFQIRIADFVAVRQGFDIFFAVNPVKTLFLTNAYGITTRAALASARKHGARIVELQHGFISPFHLGYSWPGRPHVPDTPDELWCFGDFWPDTTPLAGGMTARTIGAPYVRGLAAKTKVDRDPDLVVFTSQGVIGRRLFDLSLETARRRPDKKVLFRLHPNEALDTYETAMRAAGAIPANFALSHKTPNIFALLAQASIQVGAFSTTLFEGMSLGTRSVILDLPGIEYMRPVIARGDVLYVRSVDELVEKLDQAPLASDPYYYYAEPLARLMNDEPADRLMALS